MELLKMEHVGLTYQTKERETQALDGVSFAVNEGEFVSLVGPSGCGKTTILSLIAGLIKPTQGKIFLGGSPVYGVNPKVGYMLQKDQLFEWRTVKQNVLLGLQIRGIRDEKSVKYAQALLEKYGLSAFENSYPRQLSGGMRQRAALIRTLVTNPSLLLLDEPFSALDFQTRLDVCDDVYRIIKSENKTAVLVTHDISEAVSLSDKIVVLSARPANVAYTHEIKLENRSPSLRREESDFGKWFHTLRRELG